MPHCQKEKHDHSTKSKKAKLKKKADLAAKKQAAKEAAELEEEKKRNGGGNNIALKDGFGEYIVGCEEEMEYVAKFNMNKRSKKVSNMYMFVLPIWSICYTVLFYIIYIANM